MKRCLGVCRCGVRGDCRWWSFYLEYDVGCEGDAHEGSDCLDTVSGLSSGWLG